jgi:hypothetical protein
VQGLLALLLLLGPLISSYFPALASHMLALLKGTAHNG